MGKLPIKVECKKAMITVDNFFIQQQLQAVQTIVVWRQTLGII